MAAPAEAHPYIPPEEDDENESSVEFIDYDPAFSQVNIGSEALRGAGGAFLGVFFTALASGLIGSPDPNTSTKILGAMAATIALAWDWIALKHGYNAIDSALDKHEARQQSLARRNTKN